VSDRRQQELPAEVAGDVPDEAERSALQTVWTALDAARPAAAVSPAESSAMWAAIMAATTTPAAADAPMVVPPAAPARSRPVALTSTRPAWARRRVRGALLATVALGLLALFAGRPGAWQEVQVPRAEQRVVALPDGSSVTLDAGARLRYRDGFRGWFGRVSDRRTDLEGTAYFAVARNGAPFTVRTYNAEVRVLGTAFEVQAWPSEGTGTAVAVAEGRVALTANGGPDVTMTAGDRAVVAHATTAPVKASPVAVDRVAAWRRGGFVAVDEPLAQVVASLERSFDVVIELADPGMGARRITMYYPEAALDRILGDLATMQSLTLERQRDRYLLRQP
jgi:transmembrane sensor